MAWTFEATEAGYNKLWKAAQLKASDESQAELYANRIINAEARYKGVQASVGVPWFFIGALHMRESSNNFAGVLHNGEHIIGTGRVTTLVPAGRGPFATWEAAAIDALKMKDMHRVQDWSVARMLWQAEVFNGLGYVSRGINSPYVWAGTTNEQRGKYVADGVFSATADDTQLGVAAVLIRLAQKRPDIAAVLYPPAEPQEQPQMTDPVTPVVPPTAPPVLNTNTDELMRALLPLLLPLLLNVLTQGKGIQLPPSNVPPVAPAPAEPAPPSTSIIQRPGTQLGTILGIATIALQLFGILPPGLGESATAAGQGLSFLAGAAPAAGATGLFNSIGTILGRLFK
jgi:lysozyme family protein